MSSTLATPLVRRSRIAANKVLAQGFQSRGLASSLEDNVPVIVSTARTPIASFRGGFDKVSGPRLAETAIKAAFARIADSGASTADVQEVFMGNVVAAGIGQAPAKQASLYGGVPNTVPCTTVNKVCASGLKAVMFAAQSIKLGERDTVLAGGFESMSNIPYYLPKARGGYGLGNGAVIDGLVHDGLWDPYGDQHMGNCAEICSKTYGISREDQDAYAIESYRRAAHAWEAGLFNDEVTPVEVPGRRGATTVVDTDEEFSKIKVEKIPGLRPAFDKAGTVTAANASSINDGACAVVVMSAGKAAKLGLKPLAAIRGYGDAARLPEEFTVAPSDAVPLAAKMAGVTLQDIDYHEINEAFSVVVLANMQLMGLDHDKVNVNGGAVSLGHPIGCSGARILGTLIRVLQQKDASVGCASICNGGGGASALIIERLH